MNSLIVVAHPEANSFNRALALAAQQTLESHGNQVRLSDLHARGFAPDEHPRHYSRRKNHERFDALTEQRFSAEHDTLPQDVATECDDLMWAELLVLQFPLWWFGMPAILKGWMDRVFVYGSSRAFATHLQAKTPAPMNRDFMRSCADTQRGSPTWRQYRPFPSMLRKIGTSVGN
jgi:putative NADPH-quinone reductase